MVYVTSQKRLQACHSIAAITSHANYKAHRLVLLLPDANLDKRNEEAAAASENDAA